MTPANNTASSQQENRHEGRSIMITMAVVVVIVAIVAVFGFIFMDKPSDIVEGQVEGTTVRVSGKMAGRIVDFYVSEGDTVHAGDTLVHIHSSIAQATLNQAEAMKQVAEAANRKVDAGTRQQIIGAAADMVATAQASVDITKKTYDRMERLYSQGVVSAQKRDEAKAAYDAATAQLGAAKNQLSLAKAGAQAEDKQAAQAMVNAAGGGVEMAEAVLEDSYLTAPCNGTIDEIYPEPGELVSMGAPIINILRDDRWVTFNVREEILNDFRMGQKVKVMIPGMDKKEIDVQVYYVRDMGNYAVWRATKVTGQYDSRTFQIKARPVKADDAEGLRPGMSAIYFK
ncbi:MAG: efflux RND transporter periplasmic adaptor subunit [Bacteroidales bacterium]|nr:efflux RND transporter periplasmic adaptor subunit [Bacteroidales bacterium]